MSRRDPLSDEDLLEVLYLRDVKGLQFKEIAPHFHRTVPSLIGAVSRVNSAADDSDPDGNQNGTMPERWWQR